MWLTIISLLLTCCLISGGSSDVAASSSNAELLKKLQEVAGIYKDASKAKAMGVEKAVLVTACNHGFLNHLFNFDCFVRRLGMKYLVVAMDKHAYDTLSKHSNLTVYYMGANDVAGESTDVTSAPQEFRSKHFNVITAKKKEVAHDIMALGYDVLFSDTDVAMVRDPLPYMIWKNVDYVHSINAICEADKYWDFFYRSKYEGNTGFYFVRSNERTMKLWADAYAAAPKFPRLDDQAVFWRIIRQSIDPPILPIQKCRHFDKPEDESSLVHRKTQKHYLVSCMLESCIFSSGMISRVYIPEQTMENLLDNLKKLNETIVSLHANYISGNKKKMARMKEHGFWLADIQEDGHTYTCQPYIPYVPNTHTATAEQSAIGRNSENQNKLHNVSHSSVKTGPADHPQTPRPVPSSADCPPSHSQ